MFVKHGMRRHRLYERWRNMIGRCHNPNRPDWVSYGGRGIEVCERWQDIANYVADLDATFEPGLELDRIDNNLGYSPENCRWTSRLTQNRNKRNLIKVTIDGVTKTAAEWARENGVNVELARQRIRYYGWDPIQAVTVAALPQHEVVSRATKVAATLRSARARNSRR